MMLRISQSISFGLKRWRNNINKRGRQRVKSITISNPDVTAISNSLGLDNKTYTGKLFDGQRG